MSKFNEFIKDKNKKILISSSLGDLDELIKEMVKEEEIGISNYEKRTILDLARLIIFYDNHQYTYLDSSSLDIIFYGFLESKRDHKNDIYNLIPDVSFNFETSKICLKTINEIRKGKKLDKENRDINSLIKEFEDYLIASNYVDEILLINLASNKLSSLDKNKIEKMLLLTKEYKFGILKESKAKLSYLELNFLNSLTNKLGINLDELEVYSSNESLKISSFKTYGYYQEILNVISLIDKNKLPLEDVDILVSDSKYDNSLKAYLENYHIPYYFDYGVSIKCFSIYGLLDSICNFFIENYSIKHLYDIYRNKALNDGISNIKNIKDLRSDRNSILSKSSKYSPIQQQFLTELINIDKDVPISNLYESIINFIHKYTRVDQQQFIKEALDDKKRLFILLDKINIDSNKYKIILNLLDSSYVTIKDDNKLSHLRIAKLGSTNYLNKKYTFIIGLSAKQLQLNEIESPLLSDNDIKVLIDCHYYVDLSSERNNRFNKKLDELIKNNKCHSIYLSYSSYDSDEFRNLTPSIFYLKNINNEVNFKNNPKINLNINKGEEPYILPNEVFNKLKKDNGFSPTSLNTLYKCSLWYLYSKYFDNVEINEYENNWLKPNESGTFIHKVLEDYYKNHKDLNKDIDEGDFERIFNKVKEDTIINYPFDNKDLIEKYCSHFKKVIYQFIRDSRCSFKVLSTEYEFDSIPIKFFNDTLTYVFRGKIDRIDYLGDKDSVTKIRVFDYKSGKYHKLGEDGLTQTFIYINAVKELIKQGKFIDILGNVDLSKVEFEFHYYHFSGKEKDVKFTEEEVMKNKMSNEEELLRFIKLENNIKSFMEVYDPKINNKSLDNEGKCQYCSYKQYCLFKKTISLNKCRG